MNETLALPRLAELLAAKADIDLRDAENFIRQFFAQIENALAVAEDVNIKGLGRFSIDAAIGVYFTPDKDFAEFLNQPFDMFSPIEIDDEIEIVDTDVDKQDEPAYQSPTIEPVAIGNVKDILSETKVEKEPEKGLTSPAENIAETKKSEPISTEEWIEESENQSHRHIFGYILTAIICVTLGYLLHTVTDTQTGAKGPSVTATDLITPVDTIDIAQAVEPEDSLVPAAETIEPVVTDTVTPTRFLTTMARQYYGQMEYWVFIYLANQDKLANPNRTRPGTVVVIPQERDFTEGESREQTIARAKRLGREIYARYE